MRIERGFWMATVLALALAPAGVACSGEDDDELAAAEARLALGPSRVMPWVDLVGELESCTPTTVTFLVRNRGNQATAARSCTTTPLGQICLPSFRSTVYIGGQAHTVSTSDLGPGEERALTVTRKDDGGDKAVRVDVDDWGGAPHSVVEANEDNNTIWGFCVL